MMKIPVSPYEKIEGLVYFPRMLDKARLLQRGELREDLHANVGIAMDLWCCQFLKVEYTDVVAQLRAGLDNAALLQWCFETAGCPSEQEVKVWNAYMLKFGWRDAAAERLASRKAESGFSDRDEIQTFFDYIDADEGRPIGSAV